MISAKGERARCITQSLALLFSALASSDGAVTGGEAAALEPLGAVLRLWYGPAVPVPPSISLSN